MDTIIRVFCQPSVKALDMDERTVTHVITTASRDRAGDIIDVGGWDLSNYLKNPVVLSDHQYGIGSVIGKAVEIRKTKDALIATTQFAEIGAGFEAWNLVREGFVKSWSVGFRPQDAHSIRDGAKTECKVCQAERKRQLKEAGDEDAWVRGMHFMRQEMLEYSLVAIPMNPDAVNLAIQRGLLTRENVNVFVKAEDAPGQPAPQATEQNQATPEEQTFINGVRLLVFGISRIHARESAKARRSN